MTLIDTTTRNRIEQGIKACWPGIKVWSDDKVGVKMEPITKEEYESWVQDPITRKVLKQLEDKISGITSDLGTGRTLDEDNAEATLSRTARLVGKIEGINEIFNVVLFV